MRKVAVIDCGLVLRFMVMALASKENTYKKTGVSATRDVGDEIVCAAMRVLLLCVAFESRRSVQCKSF